MQGGSAAYLCNVRNDTIILHNISLRALKASKTWISHYEGDYLALLLSFLLLRLPLNTAYLFSLIYNGVDKIFQSNNTEQ